MWRPFTSSFVGHSYGTYVKKTGKPLDAPSTHKKKDLAATKKTDLSNLFPNNTPQHALLLPVRLFCIDYVHTVMCRTRPMTV